SARCAPAMTMARRSATMLWGSKSTAARIRTGRCALRGSELGGIVMDMAIFLPQRAPSRAPAPPKVTHCTPHAAVAQQASTAIVTISASAQRNACVTAHLLHGMQHGCAFPDGSEQLAARKASGGGRGFLLATPRSWKLCNGRRADSGVVRALMAL